MKNYESLYQVYDLGWGDFARQYLNLINWLLREQGIRQARILDIACGTGVLAIALAKRGHHVHGVDVSPKMIAVAESKSAAMANISFEVQDMKRLRAIGSYDLVTCTFDALNYVLREDALKGLFDRVASALGRSGLFVFDSNTTHHFVSREDGSLSQTLRGLSFVQRWRYDPARAAATTTFRFADGATEIHRQRPYDLPELRRLLAAAGLRVVHAWSGFYRNPFTAKSDRLFCVAQKAG